MIESTDFTFSWIRLLGKLLYGHASSPRGIPTRELPHLAVGCLMSRSMIHVPERKLSHRFAAAEPLWIIGGSDLVSEIAPYNKRMADFSDDGRTLWGAYGPRVVEQIEYVIAKLLADKDTRQSVMTTWRPNPPETKDVPCTLALCFKISGRQINAHAFMRSSDAWLGLPYDMFGFSMIAAKIACELNARRADGPRYRLGRIWLTAASSHLYESNVKQAEACVKSKYPPIDTHTTADDNVPIQRLVENGDWSRIEEGLVKARDDGTRPDFLGAPPLP